MFQVLVFLGTKVASTSTFMVLLATMSMYLGLVRTWWLGLWLALCTIIMSIVVTGLKYRLAVPRPENALIIANGYAFPSGHAAGSVFLSFVLTFYVRDIIKVNSLGWWVAGFTLLALLISYSRIYFGVHTPVQVLVGALIGAFFGVIFFYGALKLIATA